VAGPPNEPAAPPIAPPAMGANVEQDASKGNRSKRLHFISIYVEEYFCSFSMTNNSIIEN